MDASFGRRMGDMFTGLAAIAIFGVAFFIATVIAVIAALFGAPTWVFVSVIGAGFGIGVAGATWFTIADR